MSAARTVLVINAGSSNLKWSLLASDRDEPLDSATIDWPRNDADAAQRLIEGVFAKVGEPAAVGHRVVHGGYRYRAPVRISDAVRDELDSLVPLDPVHATAAIAAIDASRRARPDVPNIAVFDTAFHASLPESAAVLPVPWEWTDRWGVRRFGFHGLSVAYSVAWCRARLGSVPRRLVVCHLGSGCSITACENGRSVDTSMGFTPLDGMTMSSRSGALDPGVLVYVARAAGVDVASLDDALWHRAGLLGVSGVSADMRAVLDAADRGHARSKLAYDVWLHAALRTLGGMIAVLGGIDALVFTAGIGEHSERIRADVVRAIGFTGARLDVARNRSKPVDAEISASDSTVRIFVVTAREDLTVLRAVRSLVPGI